MKHQNGYILFNKSIFQKPLWNNYEKQTNDFSDQGTRHLVPIILLLVSEIENAQEGD